MSKIYVEDTLPEKLSELILVALGDLALSEKDSELAVRMEYWHQPVYFKDDKTQCFVCLAGAVMAKSLGIDNKLRITPCSLPATIQSKLYALNQVRAGFVRSALNELNSPRADDFAHIKICEYGVDPVKFKEDMVKIVRLLQEKNL